MRILFAGTPEPAATTLQYLLEDPSHEVVGVLTQPDARRGRGRSLHPSAVAEVATAAGIPVHKWTSLKGSAQEAEEVRSVLRSYADAGVEAVAVVAYGQILPGDILGIFRHGWINLHFSLLPRWRGAAPVQAAIAAGDATTGATTFQIVPALDAGPVIGMTEERIGITDTADDLLTRLTLSGRELLASSLSLLESGAVVPQEQPIAGMTYAAKITPADALIQWSRPAEEIQRLTRAHAPTPGPWTLLRGERYKVGLLLPAPEAMDLGAGQLAPAKNSVLVGTGDGVLEITRIQPPGKKMMVAADWARGRTDLFAEGSAPVYFDLPVAVETTEPKTTTPGATDAETTKGEQ